MFGMYSSRGTTCHLDLRSKNNNNNNSNLIGKSLTSIAVSKGRETKKDTLDLPLDINKVGINT